MHRFQLGGAFLCVCVLLTSCGGGNEYVEPPSPTVTVSHPIQRPVVDYLEFTGTTEAFQSIEIRARVKGFLQSIHFSEGTHVPEGDLLYVIEPSEYQMRVAGNEADLAVAKAALELARARLIRIEEAGKNRAVSEVDVLEARAEHQAARATLAERKAALASAELDLSYTQIQAPIAGRIGRTRVHVGNLVGAGESTLLTTLILEDPMRAVFDLSERDLLALMAETREAQAEADERDETAPIPLELGLATEEGYPHEGILDFADSEVDPSTGTFLLRGVFPNPRPYTLLPGLFVRVRIPVRERDRALLVPEAALGQDQSGSYVLVIDEQNVVHHRPVKTSFQVDGLRVVESGLEPTDWIVTQGLLRARPGGTITPQRGVAGAPPTKTPDGNATD